ncbi:hypothetical protein H4R18_005629 [Coemansia javaensis]|uniref:F-box domain-containing protein n=1 Tax=Coemansia javaensis TaxID=2761396 RepID=A0A9W8H1W8_9FUNG|nr:hypothetical protein H4R18_005629 [Coemansia javaensis]
MRSARVLGRDGISHPGLVWRYSEEQDAMVCLGHQCPIYDVFDPAKEDCCLTVHRSCYTLLLDRLERAEGAADGPLLMQRILPHINSQGVMRTDAALACAGRQDLGQGQRGRALRGARPEPQRPGPPPWLTCDPTDLPAVSLSRGGFSGRAARRGSIVPPPPPLVVMAMAAAPGFRGSNRDMHSESDGGDDDNDNCYGEMYLSGEAEIPKQLLTPPLTPTDRAEDVFPAAGSAPKKAAAAAAAAGPPARHSLLGLAPHMLLSIVSHLRPGDITALSQTCSALRAYLAPSSPVWGLVCRLALRYTPKHLSNQQLAEYYLRVRGNSRLEGCVLVQRERVERAICQIVRPLPPSIGLRQA